VPPAWALKAAKHSAAATREDELNIERVLVMMIPLKIKFVIGNCL
jgi:hypothetical protein